ncbi:MAG: biopolymer transporter ExbD [Candidatus Cloacimonetes bacterium]|nr:biopolymer transporter ExbD [Candidatus Cloacimonadota bacterium]
MKIALQKKRISSVALISFTDIIFLLLIFLLISSSFITQSGIKVDLPTATTAQKEFTENIKVTLTRQGELFLGGVEQPLAPDELSARLRDMLIENPEQVVVINADEETSLKQVVRLIELVRATGAPEFFIATDVIAGEPDTEASFAP